MKVEETSTSVVIGKESRTLSEWCLELGINENIVNIVKVGNKLTDKHALCLSYIDQKNINEKDLEICELKRGMAALMSNYVVSHYDSKTNDMYYTINNAFPVGACAIKFGIGNNDGLVSTKDLGEFIAKQNVMIDIISTGLQVKKII